MAAITVSEINVYPIKGARGVALDEARVGDRGFEHDRRFMVVDPEGTFITQREHPELATLRTRFAGDELVLEAPGHAAASVPLRPRSGAARRVRVWRSTCDAISAGEAAARLVSAHLGVACELVYMPDESIRLVNPAFAHDGEQVGFADGYPFMLLSAASLDELNARLEAKVPMNRFRPNLVVSGTAPFDEDRWRELTIGEVPFRVAKPCDRCTVVTIDQATGTPTGKEPLRTMTGFRTARNGVLFGQYLLPRGRGVIRRGDAVIAEAVPQAASIG